MLHLLMGVVAAPGAATAFELLLERQKLEGSVSAHLVRSVAEQFGRSEDTIWRWLRDGRRPTGPEPLVLTPEEILVLAACGANVALMTRELTKAGKARADLRTYQRAVKNGSVTPAQLAFFKKGDRGWRAATVHMPVEVTRRAEVFHVDHTLLDIWLRTKRRRRWVKVWLTAVIDAFTRMVIGWTVSLQPNEGVVLVALRQAFSGEHGCIPGRLVSDNGAEFLANGVRQAARALVFEAFTIDEYSPWQNGKVERFFRTLDDEFLCKQPFFTRGPRGHDGTLYGPDEGPLMVEEFVGRLTRWIDEYNRERPHSALDGRTPLQAWLDQPTPVRRVDDRLLDFMLMREKEAHAIGVYGVRLNNRWYVADEILDYKSHWIDVRYMPYDHRQIYLFEGETFIAEAVPWDRLPEKRRESFLAKRSGTLTSARAQLPSRRAHPEEPKGSTFLPMTAPGDFVSGAAPEPGAKQEPDDDLMTPLSEGVAAAADADSIEEEPFDQDEVEGLYEAID